jgi:hypothetical protein
MALSIAHRRTLNRELEQRAQVHPDKPWLIFQPVDGAPLRFTYAQSAEQVAFALVAFVQSGASRRRLGPDG